MQSWKREKKVQAGSDCRKPTPPNSVMNRASIWNNPEQEGLRQPSANLNNYQVLSGFNNNLTSASSYPDRSRKSNTVRPTMLKNSQEIWNKNLIRTQTSTYMEPEKDENRINFYDEQHLAWREVLYIECQENLI